MAYETAFEDRDSQYQMWTNDKDAFGKYVEDKLSAGKVENRHPITGLAGAFSGLGLEGGHNDKTFSTKSLKEL